MQITISFVENIGEIYNQKPCNDGYKWFVENFPNGAEHEDVFQKAIDDGKISYCTWALSKSMPKKQNVEWAIWCAKQVLPIFENKFPDDNRPRKAIKSAKEFLKNPCDETQKMAERYAENAHDAAADAIYLARFADTDKESEIYEQVTRAALVSSCASLGFAQDAACEASKVKPDLSMSILQKGFEIWRRK